MRSTGWPLRAGSAPVVTVLRCPHAGLVSQSSGAHGVSALMQPAMEGESLDGGHDHEPGDDAREGQAAARLTQLFDENRARVFFGRQLEVMFERDWFHWITNRALRTLDGGVARLEQRMLPNGSPITVCWHRGYRYPKREAARVVELVGSYANPVVGHALGDRGELLVLEGFARNQFVMRGRAVKALGERVWTATNHDLDFVFERDGRSYGVEVKNTLGYLPKVEFDAKVALALHLDLIPVFVCRALPKTWIHELNEVGGFGLVLRWQLYPPTHRDLVDRLRAEFDLPVDTPRALQEGTMNRFIDWHAQRV